MYLNATRARPWWDFTVGRERRSPDVEAAIDLCLGTGSAERLPRRAADARGALRSRAVVARLERRSIVAAAPLRRVWSSRPVKRKSRSATPRRRWHAIEDSDARYAVSRVERDGVGALVVKLRGASGDRAEDVSRVLDALDEMAATFEPEVELAVLETAGFANAYGDEAGILTSVFAGLACHWATPWCEAQREAERWDLPHRTLLAQTTDEALDRAFARRAAGSFTVAYTSDGSEIEHRWTPRGFASCTRRNGRDDMLDLRHRNRIVERVLYRDVPTVVRMPFADRTGVTHEAERRGARIVYERGVAVEADLSPWQTRRPLGADWPARVEDLVELERLFVLDAAPEDDDLVRVARALPKLRSLRIPPERITPELARRLKDARPGLDVR